MTHPTDALRLVPRRAVYDWLRDDVPLNVKMTVMPHHIDALMDRLSKAAPASPLPGGVDRNALIDVIAEAAGWGVSSGYIKAERTADAVMAHLGLPAAPTGEPK